MERLTVDTSLPFCDIAQCMEIPCRHGGSCDQRKCYEKLREYERSGMTPEEVTEIAEIDLPKRLVRTITRLLDKYDEAIAQGELIRDPIAWALYHTWKEAEGCSD